MVLKISKRNVTWLSRTSYLFLIRLFDYIFDIKTKIINDKKLSISLSIEKILFAISIGEIKQEHEMKRKDTNRTFAGKSITYSDRLHRTLARNREWLSCQFFFNIYYC